ncbi:TetR/AcrR family transcriptional regulator [Bacillus sp. PK3_68]|uniref:TetR/AcrR family transcriptional regulator n=1 Tax=Bacillus sp. PK3_68 TaxID=2027408 RepID=UPI0016042670|nr:TetR/AcrR family transcriptional regulator [Bacillus sp. PK3_68]
MSTREKLKEAAANLFADQGYEGTSLKEIAHAVGIKTPSIYAFYEGKEDLLLNVYQDILEDHYDHLQKSLEQARNGSAKERLYGLLLTAVNYHLTETGKTKLFRRLMLFPPPFLYKQITENFNKIEQMESELLREIFEEGIRNQEVQPRKVEDMVTSFLCVMDGVFLEMQYYDEREFSRRLEIIWEQYWLGIEQ